MFGIGLNGKIKLGRIGIIYNIEFMNTFIYMFLYSLGSFISVFNFFCVHTHTHTFINVILFYAIRSGIAL